MTNMTSFSIFRKLYKNIEIFLTVNSIGFYRGKIMNIVIRIITFSKVMFLFNFIGATDCQVVTNPLGVGTGALPVTGAVVNPLVLAEETAPLDPLGVVPMIQRGASFLYNTVNAVASTALNGVKQVVSSIFVP